MDVKKVWIDTAVKNKFTGATVTKLDIDSWLFGVGVGLRFQARQKPFKRKADHGRER